MGLTKPEASRVWKLGRISEERIHKLHVVEHPSSLLIYLELLNEITQNHIFKYGLQTAANAKCGFKQILAWPTRQAGHRHEL